jgi:hypothetical protein
MDSPEAVSMQNDDSRVLRFHSKSRRGQNGDQQTKDSISKFKFITSVGPPSKARDDVASSRLVRIHAMRSFLRQRGSDPESGVPRAQTQLMEAEIQKTATGKFKLASWSRKSKCKVDRKRNDEDERFHSGMFHVPKDLGPLVILNIPVNQHTYQLLHHCTFKNCPVGHLHCMNIEYVDLDHADIPAPVDHHDFTQNSVAVNPEGSFFDFALTDAALMHATLSLVALHLDLNYKAATDGVVRNSYLQAIHHQTEAVRDINRRLFVPGAHLSDGLIGTVAILANSEVSFHY